MRKITVKNAFLILLLLLCTVFIFSNSLKDSEASHKDSDVIVEIVEDVADKIQPENNVDWNYIVRKSAHLTEFFILGVLSMLLALQIIKKRWMAMLTVASFVILIATTDEIIQIFSGRSSMFSDVLIDTAGALVGIGVVLLLYQVALNIKRKVNE